VGAEGEIQDEKNQKYFAAIDGGPAESFIFSFRDARGRPAAANEEIRKNLVAQNATCAEGQRQKRALGDLDVGEGEKGDNSSRRVKTELPVMGGT